MKINEGIRTAKFDDSVSKNRLWGATYSHGLLGGYIRGAEMNAADILTFGVMSQCLQRLPNLSALGLCSTETNEASFRFVSLQIQSRPV